MKPSATGEVPIGSEQEPAGDMEFADLWKAHVVVMDGEFEYGEDIFIRGAKDIDQATKEADSFARNYWDEGEEMKETSMLPEGSGCYEEGHGYRLVKRQSVEQIRTLGELMDALCVIDVK